MIERVIFTPEADDDVAASYDWYESQEPGLVEACVNGIQRHPEMYSVAIDEFVVPRFAAFHLRFSTN
jgi:predicted choloylglycine hydrolase